MGGQPVGHSFRDQFLKPFISCNFWLDLKLRSEVGHGGQAVRVAVPAGVLPLWEKFSESGDAVVPGEPDSLPAFCSLLVDLGIVVSDTQSDSIQYLNFAKK